MTPREYTIIGVKKGNEWSNAYGTFQSYSVAFQGFGEPVLINKKVPVTQEPQVDEVLYGVLEEKTNKNGGIYYKFESKQRPETHTQAAEASNDSDVGMTAAVATKAAVELLRRREGLGKGDFEDWTTFIFDLINRLKDRKPGEPTTPPAVFDNEINLDDIPDFP